MKTGLSKKEKITEIFYNEHDDIVEVYTHNTALKKRLLDNVEKYPQRSRLADDNDHGGLHFEIDKRRLSIRPTAPYSQERRDLPDNRQKKMGSAPKNSESSNTRIAP